MTDFIPKSNFVDVFTKLGWIRSDANSGKYIIFTDPNDSSIWTLIPHDTESPEYKFYETKNLKIILYALKIDETENNLSDIQSQLINYSYKFITRIVNKNSQSVTVPYELANLVPNKSIAALRSFYNKRNKGKKVLPISYFEMNHTQQGSFIIPISIRIDRSTDILPTVPTETNLLLRDYLKTIDELLKIKPDDKDKYIAAIIEHDIDSRIVKDYLDNAGSIAKYKQDYEDVIEDISITTISNPVLDLQLNERDREFKVVHLSGIKPLPEDYVKDLVEAEEKNDARYFNYEGAKIDVEVDSIDNSGMAKFTVFAINNEQLETPFKAITTKQSKEILNQFAEAFISRDILEINGDIEKSRKRKGVIYITGFNKKKQDKNLELFNS